MVGEKGDRASFVTLEEPIGKPGEQGEVWLAHSTNEPGVHFIVKICGTPSNTFGTSVGDFTRECKVLADLRHANIVRIFDSGRQLTRDNTPVPHPFYIMEYLGSNVATLRAALENLEILPDRKLLFCLCALKDAGSALAHVHERGYCHGDVKESNILITNRDSENFQIKLIDFGFSRHLVPSGQGRIEAPSLEPRGRTSIRRSRDCKTEKHTDIFQLCYAIRRSLRLCPSPKEVSEDAKKYWPIDYAAFSHLTTLLEEWSSEDLGSKPEAAEIGDFYDELAKLTRSHDLAPDVRGAVRYLSIQEIATTAQIREAFEAVRIPPRQLVLYTERIKQLITTPQFGSLRYVRQLGFTHLVYPGAEGTRFEHSLGVYDLACQIAIRMSGHDAFRKVCESERDVLKFIVAALIHDIGHFPLAHQIEEFRVDDFQPKDRPRVRNLIKGHRGRGIQVISELAGTLRDLFKFTPTDIDDIRWLAFSDDDDEGPGKSASLIFLHNLLAGPIDLDKLDYIERDSHHCGVPYGCYLDVPRIKETMRVVERNQRPLLAFDSRVVGSLEQFATARHQLYANVYWHRAVRSATVMFKHAFYVFQQLVKKRVELERLFYETASDDCLLDKMRAMTEAILAKRGGERGVEQKAKAVLQLLRAVSGTERILFKAVLQKDREDVGADKRYGGHNYHLQRAKAREIFKQLGRAGFLADEARDLGEHNVLIDCFTDPFPRFERILVLTGPSGEPRPLTAVAPSVSKLEQSFIGQACKIRVFINPKALKVNYRSKDGRAFVREVIEKAVEP